MDDSRFHRHLHSADNTAVQWLNVRLVYNNINNWNAGDDAGLTADEPHYYAHTHWTLASPYRTPRCSKSQLMMSL